VTTIKYKDPAKRVMPATSRGGEYCVCFFFLVKIFKNFVTTLRYSELERVAFLERCVCPEKKLKKYLEGLFGEVCWPCPKRWRGSDRGRERGGERGRGSYYMYISTCIHTYEYKVERNRNRSKIHPALHCQRCREHTYIHTVVESIHTYSCREHTYIHTVVESIQARREAQVMWSLLFVCVCVTHTPSLNTTVEGAATGRFVFWPGSCKSKVPLHPFV
jgi:hypothetical protein